MAVHRCRCLGRGHRRALIKYVVDLATEDRRRTAEDERRFIDLRRENYVHLITRTDAVRAAFLEVQNSDHLRDHCLRVERERDVDPFKPGSASPEFLTSDDRFTKAAVGPRWGPRLRPSTRCLS